MSHISKCSVSSYSLEHEVNHSIIYKVYLSIIVIRVGPDWQAQSKTKTKIDSVNIFHRKCKQTELNRPVHEPKKLVDFLTDKSIFLIFTVWSRKMNFELELGWESHIFLEIFNE